MGTKERCYYLDLSKVITAFLVIFGHLYSEESTVRLFIYAYHMPLFFIISGVFHKYIGRINWGHYCKALLWPTFIFTIIAIITEIVFMGETLASQLKIYFIDLPRGEIHTILWFLLALFWCKVFLDFFISRKSVILALLLWGILLFIPVLLRFRLPFALSNGMMGLPFYALGYFCRELINHQVKSFKWIIPFALCLTINIFITLYHGRVSMLGVGFGDLSHQAIMTGHVIEFAFWESVDILLFYLNGVIGSVMILAFSLLPFPKTKTITEISKSLITVVGAQYIFIHPLTRAIGFDNNYIVSFFLAILIYGLCYVVHLLISPLLRYDFKPLQKKNER
jgi:fucose 4-O-acetylase-like acetyltransferase